jgi:hypothetical protein
MTILGYGKNLLKFLTDRKNWPLIGFIALVIFVLLFLKQCNDIQHLKGEVEAKDQEIKRQENNHLADMDTIQQSYDKKSGTLTATIRGYELTLDELNGKYSNLFGDINQLKKDWKNAKPTTIVENNYFITEKITNVDTKSTSVDSMGTGSISFVADTVFSEGNSRKISGKVPYGITLYSKSDSVLLNYNKQNFFAKLNPGSTTLDFTQEMTIYTGLNRDKKTGETTVWAKTNYPGVTFKTLKGANIQDDEATKKALRDSRKAWGLGFSLGVGGVFNPVNMSVGPGVFMGVGLNYTPKKLQFGK